MQIKKFKADTFINASAIMNVTVKDFYSKRCLNVLTKGRIQRPLNPPPSPPPGSPIAHSTFLSPSPVRRFPRFARPTFKLFAKKTEPVTRKEEGGMTPLQNLGMATGGEAAANAESQNDTPLGLFSIREEKETEADL